MELAILAVLGMLGTAPMLGYWKAKAWAERNHLRRKATFAGEDLAMSIE